MSGDLLLNLYKIWICVCRCPSGIQSCTSLWHMSASSNIKENTLFLPEFWHSFHIWSLWNACQDFKFHEIIPHLPSHRGYVNHEHSGIPMLWVISKFSLSSRIVFYYFSSQDLGYKQVKYFSKFFDILLRSMHWIQNIFFYILLLSIFCVPRCFSGGKISICICHVHQNCSILPCYHCAVGFICPFFFMESPAAIAHLLARTSIRYLLNFSVTYCQTSSSVGILLGV